MSKSIYLISIIAFCCLMALVKIFETPPPEPLVFLETNAKETSQKERVSICHSILGSLDSPFNYRVSDDDILMLYNKKPEKYCNFSGTKIQLGQIDTIDNNKCRTLTKAQVKRGGKVSSIEYNPKYSVYKDGKIYWTCERGKSPNRVESRKTYSTEEVYRFADNSDVLLISNYYANRYFYKGFVFRTIGDRGEAQVYNKRKINFTNVEQFDRNPKLVNHQ